MQFELNGQSAYAYTGGKPFNPALPCVVFIHGAQNDHSVWALQSRWFAHHGFSVLAVDLPGHGRSGGEPLSSIEALAGWIGGLIEKVMRNGTGASRWAYGIPGDGTDKAPAQQGGRAKCALLAAADGGTAHRAQISLVGHSMGSLTALETAARFPDRIARIALIGTAVPMPVSDSLLGAARDREAKAIGMINGWSHSPRGTMGGNTVPGMWLLGSSRRLMEHQKPGVLYTDLAACNAYTHGFEAAATIQCPALVISGNRDLMTSPKAAAKIAAVIRNVRCVTLDGAGHSLMGEKPDDVLDALRSFIAES